MNKIFHSTYKLITMGSNNIYSDDTILTFGKYKFTKLIRVPVDYLLRINKCKNMCEDKALVAYVESNLDKIKARQEGTIPTPQLEIICEKNSFASKKIANEELHRIRDLKQEHKKPIRSYECEKCGGWHLTSMPLDVWKEINQNK